jgi:exopolyphosphatase / guanosine-5'-triphosphate,3'-diphosphate pyrophosphatase
LKLAAIDIGSNACRLLIDEVMVDANGNPDFSKVVLLRVPLRLGFDVFDTGYISEPKIDMFVKTMKAYKLLLDVYDVKHLKACATSAMRDATNAQEIIDRIRNEAGIDVRVITGQEEAAYIYENHVAENMNNQKSYLYIDVGGGSTELTFFSGGKLVCKESFNIGTIRILKNMVTPDDWDGMKEFVKKNLGKYNNVNAIGSGGNINKVFSLSKRKEGRPLSFQHLRDYYNEFSRLSLAERMHLYKLREDRADVIVPALLIYINVMRWANIEEIYVPRIGLADGLIHLLYEDLKKLEPAKAVV